jgi:hypothetical protein
MVVIVFVFVIVIVIDLDGQKIGFFVWIRRHFFFGVVEFVVLAVGRWCHELILIVVVVVVVS